MESSASPYFPGSFENSTTICKHAHHKMTRGELVNPFERLRCRAVVAMPEPAMEAGPPRPSATAGMGADPALAMAAIMENQVEEMRKMLNKFKVCSGTTTESAGPLPGHADVLIFGPSGSGKSSLIRTFYMALHKTQQVPPDFAERIIVKDTAMNEGTLKYVSAVIKPAKLDHRGNILSSSIMCHDTRGQIWMDEREQKQLSVIMDGQVKDDSMVQQRNYRYARLLWEFWKRDSELFPPEILANGKSLNNQPHAVLFVFDGSVEEIPDGEEETRFYREIIQMCRSKGYANPQAMVLAPAAGGSEEEESISALSGPLGREAALSSQRMREVEEWIWKAEAAGLGNEEILPARQRLRDLAGTNRSIHWKREEEREAKQKAESVQMSEAQEKLESVMIEVEGFLKRRDAGALPGGQVELQTKLKDAITEAYHAKVNVQLLISARHKVLKLGEVDAQRPPKTVTTTPRLGPDTGSTKRSLAKEMLQAMKEKDASALRRVLEDALQQGVQLQGLEVARKKLAEWDTAASTVSRPAPRHLQPLRIILPDGRRGWLKVDLQWPGRSIMSCLPEEVVKSTHFTLAHETGHRGQVIVEEQLLDLDRPLSEQPEFFTEGAALACRTSLPLTEPPCQRAHNVND
eukprot:s493_g5.t1